MCTLAVAVGTDRRWPVVVAANRDERLGRAAEGFALRDSAGGIRYAAPRDLAAGGTWIGVSARGVFAALTNYHAPLPGYPDPTRRSRGELVPLALGGSTADEAGEQVATQDLARWNPFHLVVADARGAWLVWYDGERAGAEALAQGLHVVTESARDGRGPRAELVRARWPLSPSLDRLREVLTVHAAAPGDATCIHLDPTYGTRSAAIVRLAPSLADSELYEADGRTCVTPLEDRSDLLAALARAA
jgi:uncharacterized protein with NRDE domain